MRATTSDRRLSSERAVALPMAVTVLFLAALLAAAAATSAITTNQESNRDRGVKRAIGAADAGISVGVYRMNELANAVTTSQPCVSRNTSTGVLYTEAVQSDGWCRAQTETVGDGATYTYRMSNTSTTTVGNQTVSQRELLAVGTVGSVTRRVDVKIRQVPFVQVNGLLGLKALDVDSSSNWNGANFSITTDIGSNGPISFGNNVNAPGSPNVCYLGPSGTGPGSCTTLSSPIAPPSVDLLPFAATQATNSNSGITSGQGYSSSGRILSVPAGTSLTLGSGSSSTSPANYNFCSLTMGNNAKILVPTNARVRIFIDSPARTGSGCASGTGTVSAANSGAQFNPDSGSGHGQFELYVYGTSAPSPTFTDPPPATCGNDFTFNNSASGSTTSTMILYAPNSVVNITNDAAMYGSVTGCDTTFTSLSSNSSFTYSGGSSSLVTANFPDRNSYHECGPSSSDTTCP